MSRYADADTPMRNGDLAWVFGVGAIAPNTPSTHLLKGANERGKLKDGINSKNQIGDGYFGAIAPTEKGRQAIRTLAFIEQPYTHIFRPINRPINQIS
ncbi:hypothetical protein O77CONTIG1_00838 [Leptolyngbya sp. O-77]|nr:hypothetical protein O77CONTIG1_00838 [Leptolyngbya sp. O-77]